MSASAGQKAVGLFQGSGLRAQLLRGGVGGLAVKGGQALLAFAVAVMLARVLGPEGYGVYSFALAILMFTAFPAQMGVPQLIVRETAKAQVNEDWRLMRGLWRWGNIMVAVFSTFGALVVGGSLFFLDSAEGGRDVTVAIGIALIPLIALANVRAACLRGLRMVIWGQLPGSIFRPALLLILIGAWIVILDAETPLTPRGAMGLHVVAGIITFLLGTFMLWKARPKGVIGHPSPRYEPLAWCKAVIPLAMTTGLQLVNNYADLIILGTFRSDAEVGVYRAVVEVSLLVVFGLKAFNEVLQPYFSRLYALGEREKLQRVVTNSARVILAVAVPVVLVFVVWGPSLLALVFSEPYRMGGGALAILSLGQLINAGTGSVGVLLSMTGYEKVVLLSVGIAGLCNVILNFVLIPSFGIEGAAMATAASLVIWNLILWNSVRRFLHINSTAFSI